MVDVCEDSLVRASFPIPISAFSNPSEIVLLPMQYSTSIWIKVRKCMQQKIMQQTSCSERGAHCFCASGQSTIRCRQRALLLPNKPFLVLLFALQRLIWDLLSPRPPPAPHPHHHNPPSLFCCRGSSRLTKRWDGMEEAFSSRGTLLRTNFWPGQDGRKPFICKFQGSPIKATTELSLN